MSFQQNAFQQNAFQIGVPGGASAPFVVPPPQAPDMTLRVAIGVISVGLTSLLTTTLVQTGTHRDPVYAQNPAPVRILSDTTRGTPKPLTLDAQHPVLIEPQPPPDWQRPVTDTTQDQPLTLKTVVAVTPPFVPAPMFSVPDVPRIQPDTTQDQTTALRPNPFVPVLFPTPDLRRDVSARGLGRTNVDPTIFPLPVGQTAFVGLQKALWQPADSSSSAYGPTHPIVVPALPPGQQISLAPQQQIKWQGLDTSQDTPKGLLPDDTISVQQQPDAQSGPLKQPGYVSDTSRSAWPVLQVVTPPPPFVPAPFFGPVRVTWQALDTSQDTPKPLLADAQLPVRNLQHTPPDPIRPVTDTSQSAFGPTHAFPAPPPGQQTPQAVPPWPFSISDTTAESPPVAIQNVVPAPPVVVTPDQGGAGRRRHRWYYVEIDGELLRVSTQQQAVEILEQALELAEQQAPIVAKVVVERAKVRDEGEPAIEAPTVKLQANVRWDGEVWRKAEQVRAAIENMYRAALAAEIAQRDEDDVITLLLLH
jgi:hypothetical protein